MAKVSKKVLEDAKTCLECKVCNKARKNQKGFAFWFVKLVDRKICPKCKAYEQVFGKRAFEPITDKEIKKAFGS